MKISREYTIKIIDRPIKQILLCILNVHTSVLTDIQSQDRV